MVLADAQLHPVSSTNAQSLQAHSNALNALFSEYWEDHLRHAPEDSTVLGDKRYYDRWIDLILDSGALPLDVLDTKVTDWISSQK